MAKKRQKTDAQKRLALIAKQYRLSHAEIAERLGVARRTYRAWLYGERVPSRMAMKLIEQLFPNKGK
jgi:DNA-binding transcriptional regulator YiaG